MYFSRHIFFVICVLMCSAPGARAQHQLSDSLQQALAHTADPEVRVQLLLNLKDINEDSNLNLAYSIQLFREAAATGDTYAMAVAAVPVVAQYAPYPEKEDSLRYYISKLREMTPGTPEEGMDALAEMNDGFYRLRSEYNREEALRLAHAIRRWCDDDAAHPDNVFHQVKRLMLKGHAGVTIDYYEKGIRHAFIPQTRFWEEAFELIRQMPDQIVRHNFANLVYYVLSGAYNQARRYDKQEKLTSDYVDMLDAYYAAEERLGRRPYLYRDNCYVNPFRQLIRCTLNIKRDDLAEMHFKQFRRRMMNADGENLLRNKTYLDELGYLWKGIRGDYAQSILYCDSLITMIGQGKGYFRMNPSKIYQVHRDRSLMLARAGRYEESYAAYERTREIQDSIFNAGQLERSETIRLRHDMDRLKLAETRAVIRNRTAALISFIAFGILLLGTGVYLAVALRRNRRLQADIARHALKAQESERMKSIFVNTICCRIGPPLKAIDRTAHTVMTTETPVADRRPLLEEIRENTDLLLSTLDNMLEAASLDSLTEKLRVEPVDIDRLCRAELIAVRRLRQGQDIEYTIETPGEACIIPTHPKYFALVVRALLDNARKFTSKGRISLSYETDAAANELRVRITDTGCGVPPGHREELFGPLADPSSESRGLSLALCRMIAEHLAGSIRLDAGYTKGARFIFTVPLKP